MDTSARHTHACMHGSRPGRLVELLAPLASVRWLDGHDRHPHQTPLTRADLDAMPHARTPRSKAMPARHPPLLWCHIRVHGIWFTCLPFPGQILETWVWYIWFATPPEAKMAALCGGQGGKGSVRACMVSRSRRWGLLGYYLSLWWAMDRIMANTYAV